MKSNLEKELTNSYKNATDVIKQIVTDNVIVACRSKKVNVSDDDLRRIVAVIDQSIDQGFTRTIKTIQAFAEKYKSLLADAKSDK